MKIAKINIEGYIGQSDMLSIFDGEETFSLSKLKKVLDGLDSDVTDLHIYINSGGGSVSEGWAIYDKLKTCGKKVTTIGEGIVGSIATIIFAAGDVRKLHENSKFFIHNPYWLPGAPEPMESKDLIALGEELKNEQSKILSFYSKITGKAIDEIAPLMEKATDLTSEQAIEMGFAHSVINEFVAQNSYRLVALIEKTNQSNINHKTNKMSKEKTTVLAAFQKFGALLNNVLGGEVVNMELKATDAEGNEVNLVIETETEDLTGKKAYIVDAEGNQTEANGEFKDADGKTLKIEAGVIIEVIEAEPMPNELDALKAELAVKAGEIENLKAELLAKNSEVDAFKANIETINGEFKALKNIVIGSKANFEVSGQQFNNQKPEQKETNPFLDGLAKSISKKK